MKKNTLRNLMAIRRTIEAIGETVIDRTMIYEATVAAVTASKFPMVGGALFMDNGVFRDHNVSVYIRDIVDRVNEYFPVDTTRLERAIQVALSDLYEIRFAPTTSNIATYLTRSAFKKLEYNTIGYPSWQQPEVGKPLTMSIELLTLVDDVLEEFIRDRVNLSTVQ